MKKFTIFFLMVFMYLGNQAKCETVLASSGDGAAAGRNHATWFSHHASVSPNASGRIASDYTYRTGGVYEANRVNATQNLQVHIEGPTAACSSATVTLHAVVADDPVTANTTYSYTWMSSTNHGAGYSAADGATNNQELVVAMSSVDPVKYYKVIVQRYENGVCVGPGDTSAVFTLTRVNRGTVNVTVTPATACAQKTLTATTTSTAQVARWIWLKGDVQIANTGTNNTYVATTAGDDYKAVAVYEGTDFCNDTSTAVEVAFATSSPVQLEATNAAGVTAPGDDFICLGGQVRLKATSGIAPYTFYRGGTLIGTSDSILFDIPTTTGTISYSVVDAGGCTAEATFNVTDFSSLIIQSTGSTHFCVPATAALTIGSNAEQFEEIGATFNWFHYGLPDPTTSYRYNLDLSSLSGGSEEPMVVVLEISDPNRNCFYRSNELEFWLHSKPTATLLTDSVCSGNSATVTVVTEGFLGDSPTYAWSGDATGTTATATTGVLTSDGTVNVTVSAMEPYTTCFVSATGTVKVVNTVAEGQITAEPNPVCSGSDVVFSAEEIGAGFTNPVYTWDGDATGSGATATVTGVTAPVTATVTVTGENAPATACSVTATKTVEVMTALPTAADIGIHSYIQGTTIPIAAACEGAALDISAEGFTPEDNYIYTWYRNGIELPSHSLRSRHTCSDNRGRTAAGGCSRRSGKRSLPPGGPAPGEPAPGPRPAAARAPLPQIPASAPWLPKYACRSDKHPHTPCTFHSFPSTGPPPISRHRPSPFRRARESPQSGTSPSDPSDSS